MRWSTRFIIGGVLLLAVGFFPLSLGHLSIDSFYAAASFFATGILLLLIGIMMRKIAKSLG